MTTSRRKFLTATSATLAAVIADRTSAQHSATPRNPFTLAFAPHPSMFKASAGDVVLDQIRFAHDQGFTAWEHNSMLQESPDIQEKIGQLLRDLGMPFAICRAVNSPACKILFDIYHQQITEGNLIPNIDQCWDEIGYFQIGDNPGRKEPGTGEINYTRVLSHVHERSKDENRSFVFGMEHGNSKRGTTGEQAVIDAYRAIDPA